MKPLEGKTVLVTRPRDQAAEFVRLLEERGANAILFPTIEISPASDWNPCDDALDRLGTFDGVVFTSLNAVKYFIERLKSKNSGSVEALQQQTVYAVGGKTAQALSAEGIASIRYSNVKNSLGLGSSMIEENVEGKWYLFPRGNIAREELPALLHKYGANVHEVIVYETHKPESNPSLNVKKSLSDGIIDVVAFFSPSSVENFLTMVPSARVVVCPIAAIGQTTADAALEAFGRVDIIADHPSAAGLVKSIVRFYEQHS